jgi:hypothetical protein
MRRFTLILGLLVALVGCGGQAGQRAASPDTTEPVTTAEPSETTEPEPTETTEPAGSRKDEPRL